MSTRYRRNPDIEGSPMLDETILFIPASKKFCVLNGSAAVLWQRLDRPSTADELAAELCKSFDDVEPEAATSDVRRVLGELEELALIHRSD